MPDPDNTHNKPELDTGHLFIPKVASRSIPDLTIPPLPPNDATDNMLLNVPTDNIESLAHIPEQPSTTPSSLDSVYSANELGEMVANKDTHLLETTNGTQGLLDSLHTSATRGLSAMPTETSNDSDGIYTSFCGKASISPVKQTT